MGFLNNQLTQLNFQDHLLKTLKVICREDVQQPNNQITIDLEAAPAEPFTVTLTPLSFTSIVDQDKVFNTWTLEITITDADGNVEVIEETYQEDAVVCPFDLTQWPGQTIVQKHDVSSESSAIPSSKTLT